MPELLADARFATGGDRFDHADALNALIVPWLLEHSQGELVELLQAHNVPASPVLNLLDVQADEQLAARGFWQPLPHLGEGVRAPSLPVVSPAGPAGRPRAPQLGEDTEALLASLDSARRQCPHRRQSGDQVHSHLRVFASWSSRSPGRARSQPASSPTLGADVIRIEHRTARGNGRRPDGSRMRPPPGWRWGELPPPAFRAGIFPEADPGARPWNRSGPFNKMQRNKRSLGLDLKSEAGQAVFRRLIAKADILLDNYRPRALDRLGFDFDAVVAINPRIVRVSMSGHGATGPYRERGSWGPILEAHSGFAAVTGYDDGGPMKLGAAFPDGIGGLTGAFAVLDALREGERTGQAVYVNLSQFESYLSIGGELLVAASAAGEPPAPRANRSPAFAPQGVYPSEGEDAWVALTVESEAAWGRFVDLLACPALADPALRMLPERRRRHDAIDEQIAAWTSARSAHEAAALLQEVGIAAGPVLSNLDLIADEHLRARAMLVTIEHPDAGAREVPWLSDSPLRDAGHAIRGRAHPRRRQRGDPARAARL